MTHRAWPCDFRQRTGPLDPPYALWPSLSRDGLTPFQRGIRHVFVERSACGMLGHAYHLVAQLRDPRSGHHGWHFARATEAWLTCLLRGEYRLAPGFDGTESWFVLLPNFNERGAERDDAAHPV